MVSRRLIDKVIHLGELAMRFGRIDRSIVAHPDGTPESDSDHTVMLGWIACALAARWYPRLDLGLIAQFALVHDAPEIYAGDTPTLDIDEAGLALKHAAEREATGRLITDFASELPWLPSLIMLYEQQELTEARFVRGVDKALTRIVHLLDGGCGLRAAGITRAKWDRLAGQTLRRMLPYTEAFPELLALRDELGRRITDTPGLLADEAVATT